MINKKFMSKKILKILGIILGLMVLSYIGWSVYLKIRIDRGDIVIWDGKTYTKEELKQKFPPQEYNVPAKNTPEEVYANFRSALLKNDIEGALAQIVEGNREEYRQAFQNKEKFDKWVNGLPEKIENIKINNNFGVYYWDKGDNYEHSINFIKNSDGYWQIDQI